MKKQAGFTLLSTMLALTVLFVVLSLTTALVQLMNHHFQPRLDSQKEVQLFFAQTANELHQSTSVLNTSDHQRLTLIHSEGVISYSFLSPGRIVRRVNEQGYEIVLQRVAGVSFQTTDDEQVSIHVTDQQGRDFYWTDRLYLRSDADERQSTE
ncbi:competence type IV pilus minor pilin ComGF [Sporolactobacillus terrae]|uniref:Competence protein ComGF n=1 Tax=Sporolactobacillus terrae TaxID=269673 RepID=A0A5K7WZH0_9BACL|nr:competence type IV pilus minor pilin ComGF [Sporolactobacillus terrae]BBN99129.1 hypothetical protein St703_18340 [Sporolactobacillus terrae]